MLRLTVRALGIVLVLGVSTSSFGQTVDDVRDSIRTSVRDVDFGAFASLIFLAEERELSGAHYDIDDASNTTLSSIALPYRTTFHPWGKAPVGIYLEGALGYARSNQRVLDLWGGNLPGLQTTLDSKSTSYGGLAGAGPEFRIIEALTVTPLVNVGMARIENDANYGGPGATVSARVLDGIAFNWSALTVSGGGAVRVDWIRPLGKDYQFAVVGRYDVRWTETVDTDDRAQEFSSWLQLLTLRADVLGPTGLRLFAHSLSWRALVAYRRFIEGSLEGVVRDIVLFGGGLELDVTGSVPLVRAVSFNGGVIATAA